MRLKCVGIVLVTAVSLGVAGTARAQSGIDCSAPAQSVVVPWSDNLIGKFVLDDLTASMVGTLGASGGILIGITEAGLGLLTADLHRAKDGAIAGAKAIVPRFGFFSGPGWGRGENLAHPFRSSVDRGAWRHDCRYEFAASNSEIRQADRDLIKDVWTDFKGPLGLGYGSLLTVLFGIKIMVTP